MPSIVITIIKRIFGGAIVLAFSPPELVSVAVADAPSDQKEITWTYRAPAVLGGGTRVTGYESEVQEVDASGNVILGWRARTTNTLLTRSVRVTDGTRWQMRVRAINDNGERSPYLVTAPVLASERQGNMTYAGGAMTYGGAPLSYGS